jgi:transposase
MAKNQYVRRAKISEAGFRRFLRYFALDMEATKIAILTGLNRNTVNRLAMSMRKRICEQSEGEAEIAFDLPSWRDRSLPPPDGTKRFGGRLVLGWITRDRHVYVQIAPKEAVNGGTSEEPFWRQPASDCDFSFSNRAGVTGIGSVQAVAEPVRTVKTLDNFWGQAKLRLMKFKGTSESTFILHLKECEFRFNHRADDIYLMLLRLAKARPLE